MGKLREVCGLNTPGAYVQILDMLRSNEVTSATNSFTTEVLRTPRANDVIEGRLWVERASAVDCDAVCEWWALPFAPNRGEPVLIARSNMTISAVKVSEDGSVKATRWPDYFFGFLELMGPRSEHRTRSPAASPVYDYGACLFQEPPGPKRNSVFLAEQTFDTSLQDANVVGNIYFASYGAWQGRLRDRFFYELSPGTFRVQMTDTELICTDFKMIQLREAMPFDRIRVKMYLSGLFERAVQLRFEYFLVTHDGDERKLAVGEHTALWASHVTCAHPVPRAWPSQIMEALAQRANIHGDVPGEAPVHIDQQPIAQAPPQ